VGANSKGTVAKLSIHITCQEGLLPAGAENVLEEAGKFKIKLEFKACTVTTVNAGVIENQPKCKVASFTAVGSGELTEAGIISVTNKPFATIEIAEVTGAGACTLTGKFEITGTQLCAIPHYSLTGNLGSSGM
jgi:hypothetical protein